MAKIEKSATLKLILSGIVLATGIGSATAGPVGPLKTFSAGTPAKAADVNGNFTTIVNTVNANDARLTTVETNKQNILIGGGCTTGSAIRAIAADGTVTCQSTGGNVGFASVNALVGVPESSATPTSLGFASGPNSTIVLGRFQTGGSSDSLLVPIVLPQGATVTAFSFTCLQNTTTVSCTGSLFRDDIVQLASVSIPSTSQSATVQTASTTTISSTPANAALVDNQNFAYFVLMSMNATNTSSIIPIRATVTYTLP
jgi:hypothetical protein